MFINTRNQSIIHMEVPNIDGDGGGWLVVVREVALQQSPLRT